MPTYRIQGCPPIASSAWEDRTRPPLTMEWTESPISHDDGPSRLPERNDGFIIVDDPTHAWSNKDRGAQDGSQSMEAYPCGIN